jgi:hypothetical protein
MIKISSTLRLLLHLRQAMQLWSSGKATDKKI